MITPGDYVDSPQVESGIEGDDIDAAALDSEFYGDFPEQEEEHEDATVGIEAPQRKSAAKSEKAAEKKSDEPGEASKPDAPVDEAAMKQGYRDSIGQVLRTKNAADKAAFLKKHKVDSVVSATLDQLVLMDEELKGQG